MSTLSEFWRKQQFRWYARGIPPAHQLRRQLAYYVARHGFEIGDYSFGKPSIRFFNDDTRLKIGKYCSLALGSTLVLGGNHSVSTVTAYPLGLAVRDVSADELPKSKGDIVIGSDVWIASGALILSGVTIGDGAIVGAGSVVLGNVPPYTVVFGNPARVMSKRFSDEFIAELLELRWWDLDAEQVQSLRPLLESTDIGGFIDACRKCRGLPPVNRTRKLSIPAKSSLPAPALPRQWVIQLIQNEIPEFSSADLNTPFERLGIDSFGMLMLRARLEQSLEATLDDATWTLIAKPADVVRIASGLGARGARAAAAGTVSERRSYAINMPQMALGGLSETWLFKELGDMHWGMIMNGLRTASSELKDANGDRLYATFTRFNLESDASLVAYKENEELRIDANISRYGAGTFFSEAQISGDGKSARARLMSSFSKYGEAGSNRSLLKGQPELPADCGIPELPDLPGFGLEYRAVRAARPSTPIFECEYEIIPSHDINGVGLLYFAAYPTINDICAVRHAGRTLMTDFSTCSRDVFYFGNSDPDETLIYRIHRWRGEMDCIAMECSLSRKSDNGLMAYIATVKKRWRSPASATPTSFAMASP